MKIPTKLKTIPILESVFEIKFETSSPDGVNVGLFYTEFKNEFSNPIKINQTNKNEIVISNVDFKFLPAQQLTSKDGKCLLRYGQNVISLHFLTDYDKFDGFSSRISSILDALDKMNVITTLNRIGLRYIDFFNEKDIPNYSFDKLNFSLKIGDLSIGEKLSFSSIYKLATCSHQLQIFKSLEINHQGNLKTGDLLDIDSFLDLPKHSLADIKAFIPNIHNEQKEIFFKTIGPIVTALLGPTYE